MLPIQSVLVAFVLMTGYTLAEDLLKNALDESYGINMDDLYNDAVIHLDMESVEHVSSKLTSKENLTVYSSADNCSNIMQTDVKRPLISKFDVKGIPWHNNNSAMRINDTGSYVEVKETIKSSKDGLSVSLWIKSYRGDSECTVLTVGNDSEPLLKLKRKPDGYNYSLHVGLEEKFIFRFQETWEWNMLSFTVNLTHLTPYENGASKPKIEISGNYSLPTVNDIVKIRLNGDNFDPDSNQGCAEVELDEVALWSRTLNLSEFIALRVQPFDTNCTVNVTVLVRRIEDGTPEEASAAVVELRIVVSSNESDWDIPLIDEVDRALEAMHKNDLLSTTKLDGDTKKENREAFVLLTGAILNAATKYPGISDDVKEKNVIQRMDEVMNKIYFSKDFPAQNETITAPFITSKYIHLDVQPDGGSLSIEEDSFKFTIPQSVFGEKNPKIIVTVFDESINEFVTSDVENITIADKMVSLQLDGIGGQFQDPIELIFPNAGKNNAQGRIVIISARMVELPSDGVVIPCLDKSNSLEGNEDTKLKNSTATCNYLDLTRNKWMTDGIETKTYTEGDKDLICYIAHLTNFAVLLSPTDLDEDDTLEALTYVLLAISIICLIVTLVVLMCLREIANTQRVQILKHFIFALLMSQLLFVFTTDLVKNTSLCMIFAAILHYFWLATFTWMLVQGIQLYTKVRRLVGGNIKQIFYVLFAWGFPLPVATIPLAIFNKLYYERAKTICWIPYELIWFFAVPVVLIFCINLGVTVLVMKTFLTVKVNKDKSDAEKLKSSMRAVVVMVPVLGLTWAFGFLLLVDQNKLFQYLFVILNTTQGIFVFLLHLVMNEDVRSAVLRRRNKVAANTENTIFTKLPRNKSEHSGGTGTETSKAPLNSDSTTNM